MPNTLIVDLKSLIDFSFGWTVSVITRSKYTKKLKRRPSSISMQFQNLLGKIVSFKNVSKYNRVINKRYIVIRKKIDKRNEFIEKMMEINSLKRYTFLRI